MNAKRKARERTKSYYSASHGNTPRKKKKRIKKAVFQLVYDLMISDLWGDITHLYPNSPTTHHANLKEPEWTKSINH